MRPVNVWFPWGPLLLLLLHLLCSSSVGSPSPSTDPEKKVGSQGLRFRLAGFPRKPYEGRVEIQRAGEWGTICDDDFTLQAAHVLCRELGFTEATGWTHSAKYGPGTGRIWLDNLSCSGTEGSVTECASRGWGNSDCTHDEDAGVICKDQRLPGFSDSNVIEVEHHLQVEEVRLRPAVDWGRRPLPVTEGLVEVRLPEGWSQVCDKGWSAHNSHVVCGMLGFPGEKRVNMAFYRSQTPASKTVVGFKPKLLPSEEDGVNQGLEGHSSNIYPMPRSVLASVVDFRGSTVNTSILPLGTGGTQNISEFRKWKDGGVTLASVRTRFLSSYSRIERAHTNSKVGKDIIQRSRGSVEQIDCKRASSRQQAT